MKKFFIIGAFVPLGLLLSACGDDTACCSGGAGGSGGSGTGAPSTASSSASGGSVVNPLENMGQLEEIAATFVFTEGPLWLSNESALLFSDVAGNTMYKLKPPSKTAEVFRNPSNNANGHALDPQGRLITCEHTTRRLTRTEGAQVTPVVESFQGKKLNSPNDVIVRTDGTIYFTDPPFGIPMGQMSELNFNGVFRIDPQGAVSLIDDKRDRPNGVALSPDEKTLYVADTTKNELWSYAVNADGSTEPGKLLTMTGGGPDGMAVDDAGNLYVTAQPGIEVYRSDGTKWGTIPVQKKPSNCGFGGADRKTLYITARESLYQIKLNLPGKP
jgi:gluconolactonase